MRPTTRRLISVSALIFVVWVVGTIVSVASGVLGVVLCPALLLSRIVELMGRTRTRRQSPRVS